jgi:hypothetical protein
VIHGISVARLASSACSMSVIESIAPDGRISARLDDNRVINFNAAEHRHFDHGYAVTSHSSQGLTIERVLVNADTGVHPDLLNSRFAYVSISRALHDAQIFTDNTAALIPGPSHEAAKTSAIEIHPPQGMNKPQAIDIVYGAVALSRYDGLPSFIKRATDKRSVGQSILLTIALGVRFNPLGPFPRRMIGPEFLRIGELAGSNTTGLDPNRQIQLAWASERMAFFWASLPAPRVDCHG